MRHLYVPALSYALIALALALPSVPATAGLGGGAGADLELVSISPAPGATNVCVDTPLRLVFDGPPVLSPSGTIQILDDAGTVIDSIDTSVRTLSKTIGGLSDFNYYPVIITEVDLYSHQDTLQINGQAYLSNCYIEGDVDFMWGAGPCFFENCRLRALRSKSMYTQIRNPPSNHGYVYKNCTFEGAPGVTDGILSRVLQTRFPASEVVLLDCTLTKAVSPVGWHLDSPAEAPQVHFWEYNSRDPDGKPIDGSQRFVVSKRLTQEADAETITHYSNPTWVLGHDWNPRLAPIFAKQPTGEDMHKTAKSREKPE